MLALPWVIQSYLQSIQHGNLSKAIAHPHKSRKTGEVLYLLGEVLFASELLTHDAR